MNAVNLEHSAQVCAPVREGNDNQRGTTMEQTKPKSSMQKFRCENKRFDFYPTEDALAVIERLRKCNPGATTRELLDALIVKGGKVYFPDSVVATKDS